MRRTGCELLVVLMVVVTATVSCSRELLPTTDGGDFSRSDGRSADTRALFPDVSALDDANHDTTVTHDAGLSDTLSSDATSADTGTPDTTVPGSDATSADTGAPDTTDRDAALVDASLPDSPGGPVLSSISPSWGYVLGGLELQLRGIGFDANTTATIGDTDCPIISRSETQLVCVAAALPVGEHDVTVTNAALVSTLDAAFSVRRFSRITTLVGSPGDQFRDGAGDVATLSSAVNDLALHGHELLLADGGHFRLRVVDLTDLNRDAPAPAQVTVDTLAGTGDDRLLDSDDSTGKTAAFHQLDSLELGADGTVYVMQTRWPDHALSSAIRKVDLRTGETSTLWTGKAGAGQAYDGSRQLLFGTCGDEDRINRLDLDSLTSAPVAGTAGVATFNCPYGLVRERTSATLYVSDYEHHQIKRVDLTTGAVTTIAGTGSPGWNDGNGAAAAFSYPAKLSLHGRHLLVADQRNCAIRLVDLGQSERPVRTVAGRPGECELIDGPLSVARLGNISAAIYAPQYGIFFSSTDYDFESVPAHRRVRLLH
jgi:hypothetical protein